MRINPYKEPYDLSSNKKGRATILILMNVKNWLFFGTVLCFSGYGFIKQGQMIDDRRKLTFEIINRIKEEERPARIEFLKQQGRL